MHNYRDPSIHLLCLRWYKYVTCSTSVAKDSQLLYRSSYANVVCCIAVPLGGIVCTAKQNTIAFS